MSRQDVLITAEEVADRFGAVVLLDVGAAEGGRHTGVAGAAAVSLADFAGEAGGTRGARPLPEIADLQARARSWGIDDDSEVVVYDDKGGLQAARGWWTLRWAGLGKVRLLDGGLQAAAAAGLPITPLLPSTKAGRATLTGGALPVIDADEAADFARRGRLIDARAPKPFRGDPGAREGGHIEGSINLPAGGNLDATGRFLHEDDLRPRLLPGELGASGELAVSCGSGVSAAHTAAALAILGLTPALFVGSWSAWSADPTRPVSYGSGGRN